MILIFVVYLCLPSDDWHYSSKMKSNTLLALWSDHCALWGTETLNCQWCSCKSFHFREATEPTTLLGCYTLSWWLLLHLIVNGVCRQWVESMQYVKMGKSWQILRYELVFLEFICWLWVYTMLANSLFQLPVNCFCFLLWRLSERCMKKWD